MSTLAAVRTVLLGALAATLATAVPAAASGPANEPVSYSTRVDADEKVWVDVKNGSAKPIEVTSLEVSFTDAKDKVVDHDTVPCEKECGVAAGELATFGPIAPPEADWEKVTVHKVAYRPKSARGGFARKPPDPPKPEASPSSKPNPKPTPAAKPKPSPSPEPAPSPSPEVEPSAPAEAEEPAPSAEPEEPAPEPSPSPAGRGGRRS